MKQKKSPTRKLLTIALILLVIFALGAVVGKSMGWLSNEEDEIQVEAAEANLKTITQLVSGSGKMQPEVEVIMRSDVSGEIIELNVKEGDYVERGDLLLRIKPDIYQARIDEINASLLTQKARLEQARATMLQAESSFERQKKLLEREAISQSDYDAAKSNYEAETANYNAAQFQVQSAEAQLKQAEEELERTIIRAPQEGTISRLGVEEGERVLGNDQMAGDEIMRIANMYQMEVQVEVNENDIVHVSVGDTSRIEADSYPERDVQGIVTEIANSADITGEGTNEQVTNYQVKVRVLTPHNLEMTGGRTFAEERDIELSNEDFIPNFKPGMSATVDIETETVENVVSAPIQAVTVRDFAQDQMSDEDETEEAAADTLEEGSDNIIPQEDMRRVVFVVEDGIAKRREVKTGISDNTHIQIVSGLEAGEQIVTGSYRVLSNELNDGDKVTTENSQQFASQ